MAGQGNRRDGRNGPGNVFRARAALLDGDFKRARALALAALQDSGTAEAEKNDAKEILDATKIDRGQIAAALVMFAILLTLFTWVVMHTHSGF